MGNTVAGAVGSPWHDMCLKPLDKAVAVMEEFYDQNLDFGISCADLQVLLPLEPAETCAAIVTRFACGTSASVLNALDFACALIVVSEGGFDAKMRALHRAYDFERRGELSMDEAIMMVVSTLRGLQCLTNFTGDGGRFTANDRETEERVEALLTKAFAEKNNTVLADDFLEWAGAFLECPDTPEGKDASGLTVADTLRRFKLCTEAEAAEFEDRCDPTRAGAAAAAAAGAEGAIAAGGGDAEAAAVVGEEKKS